MICSVLTLLKTLLDIALFRKGPQSIPSSSALLSIVVALWILVGIIAIVAVGSYSGMSLLVDLVLTIVGVGLYSFAIQLFGKGARLLPALTAIMGCAAMFGFAIFVGRIWLPLILVESQVSITLTLIVLWSIGVEGHIMARTIERQWVIGFLLALSIFIAQLQLISVLNPLIGNVE